MHDGCTKTIHASVHGVKEDGRYLAIGDTCFIKRYGSATALGPPKINANSGAKGFALTPEQLEALDRNIDELLKQLEDEWCRHQKALRLKLERVVQELPPSLAKAQAPGSEGLYARRSFFREDSYHQSSPVLARPAAPAPPPNYQLSPEWFQEVDNRKLIFCYLLKDGSKWVMYASQNGRLILRPWPNTFSGWQYKVQPSMGRADLENGCYLLLTHTSGLDVSRFTSCAHPVEINQTFVQLRKS